MFLKQKRNKKRRNLATSLKKKRTERIKMGVDTTGFPSPREFSKLCLMFAAKTVTLMKFSKWGVKGCKEQ